MATLTENINKAIADFNGIKTAITEKGVPVADTDGTETYAAAVKRVYAKGKADELGAFWDAWQDGGNRTDYRGAFFGKCSNISALMKLNYDVKPILAGRMFESSDIASDLVEFFERLGVKLDFSRCTNFIQTFSGTSITRIGEIDTRSAVGLGYMINGNVPKIVELVILKSDGSQIFNTLSFSVIHLENISFEGMIGNNIWFNVCTKLTTASLLSILTALTKDSAKASGKTITLATAHKAKIEADTACTAQLNAAITAGWTVTYV